jgi:hypothetical protein
VVEIEDRLNAPRGTIESAASLVILLEMIAPGAVVPELFASRMVTPLLGVLELPRIMVCPLLAAAVLLLELAADWLGVVVSLALESVSELVLVTPGSAEIVDPEVTRLAVLDPIVELTPPIIPVVELGTAAVLESDVL